MGNEFLVKGPRRIFARLLMRRLSPEELVRVIGDERELDRSEGLGTNDPTRRVRRSWAWV